MPNIGKLMDHSIFSKHPSIIIAICLLFLTSIACWLMIATTVFGQNSPPTNKTVGNIIITLNSQDPTTAMDVSWEGFPENNWGQSGGIPITSNYGWYTISANDGANAKIYADTVPGDAISFRTTVTGLTRNTIYTIEITPHNVHGPGLSGISFSRATWPSQFPKMFRKLIQQPPTFQTAPE